jgi:Protein of unknown function (DUF1552)
MAKPLSRRTFLRGLGGAAIALPFLEAMLPKRASSATAPQRYVYTFAGTSISPNDADGNLVVPTAEGPLGPGLPQGMKPVNDLGIEPYVSIVSGLLIPWGDVIPPGGRRVGFHASSLCPLVCGTRSDPDHEAPTSETSEFLAARTLSPDPAFQVPTYRVQPAYYRGSNGTGGDRGKISARMDPDGLKQVDPFHSPQSAWSNLNFQPTDPAELEKAKALLARRKSILDLVAGDTESLIKRLGAADKIRMQRHLDELRALEKQLSAIQPGQGACQPLPDPGTDPDIGGPVEADTGYNPDGGYANDGAWSNEELRATIMMDLIHMALVCDRARAASVMFTQAQCFMNMHPIFGYASDLHEISHGSMGWSNAGMGPVADCIAWHMKHFGTLVKKLAETEDSDGKMLIDNTALILALEGGHGYDPEQNSQKSPHSTENMAIFIAGRAGGLNAGGGKHVVKKDAHPVQVINTALHAVGVEADLGEVSGDLMSELT